eukprot:CAMPEP_0206478390 /NCGR_PEP_ID=MMETSP0324_2-20121206/35994_1 /ASSEMBLY_ACC=CAM_ASM_000836 /TAXON_ID=2866 /ORGANISM="Crypthecodinium cohnii, Strain Seligo" /LENGTH=307 /DNA_ID=CAMNT_0053954625 /DNA_START=101 /DNA_END=1021 /DNA_ORIENTATION=-
MAAAVAAAAAASSPSSSSPPAAAAGSRLPPDELLPDDEGAAGYNSNDNNEQNELGEDGVGEELVNFGNLDNGLGGGTAGEARFEMMNPDEDNLNPWDQATLMANVCEFAGCFDDMKVYMKERCECGPMLGPEERDLLSVAYKGNLEALRKAYRIATLIAADTATSDDMREAKVAAAYTARLQRETQDLCLELLEVLGKLLARADAGEPIVFYLKLQADYRRYLAEVSDEEDVAEAHRAAEEGYLEALNEAEMHLLHTHPVKLGLLLNWSVFLHEGLERTAEAVFVAKTAVANAMQSLEGMPEEAFKD